MSRSPKAVTLLANSVLLSSDTPDSQPSKPWLVLGVGNDFRGDDAFGLAVVERLNQPKFHVRLGQHFATKVRPDVSELLDHFQKHEKILIIDALHSKQHPTGTRLGFDLNNAPPLEETLRSSTHLVSIQESVALAKVLDLIPKQLHVFGITSTHFDIGEPLSAKTASAIDPMCDSIIQWLNSECGCL